MTDISESGIEAAVRFVRNGRTNTAITSIQDEAAQVRAIVTGAIQAYLPFHPPASREEGLREAAKMVAGLRDDSRQEPMGFKEIADRILALIPTKPEAGEPDYLVWSNEHRQWWRPDRSGYTTSIHAAGRYPRSEALRLAKSARNGWGAYGNPDEIAVPLADALLCMPDAALQSKKPE